MGLYYYLCTNTNNTDATICVVFIGLPSQMATVITNSHGRQANPEPMQHLDSHLDS